MRVVLGLVLFLVGCMGEEQPATQESVDALYEHTTKVWEAAELVYPSYTVLNTRCDIIEDSVDCEISLKKEHEKRKVFYSRKWCRSTSM